MDADYKHEAWIDPDIERHHLAAARLDHELADVFGADASWTLWMGPLQEKDGTYIIADIVVFGEEREASPLSPLPAAEKLRKNLAGREWNASHCTLGDTADRFTLSFESRDHDGWHGVIPEGWVPEYDKEPLRGTLRSLRGITNHRRSM